jgi:hypothetical protein
MSPVQNRTHYFNIIVFAQILGLKSLTLNSFAFNNFYSGSLAYTTPKSVGFDTSHRI